MKITIKEISACLHIIGKTSEGIHTFSTIMPMNCVRIGKLELLSANMKKDVFYKHLVKIIMDGKSMNIILLITKLNFVRKKIVQEAWNALFIIQIKTEEVFYRIQILKKS